MAVKITGNDYIQQELYVSLFAGYQCFDVSYIPNFDAKLLPQLPTATFTFPFVENEEYTKKTC